MKVTKEWIVNNKRAIKLKNVEFVDVSYWNGNYNMQFNLTSGKMTQINVLKETYEEISPVLKEMGIIE